MADGTGLTPEQKVLVKKTWEIMKKDIKGNGVDLFHRFFKANPSYQDLFQQFKGLPLEEVIKTGKMRAHGTTVMHSITTLVDNLDDIDCLLVLLEKIARNHYPRGIERGHYERLKLSLVEWLVANLGDALDEATAEAWTTTVDTIIAVVSGVIEKVKEEKK